MKKNWFTQTIVVLVFLLYALSMPIASAQAMEPVRLSVGNQFGAIQRLDNPGNTTKPKDDITIGNSNDTSTLEKDRNATGADKTPSISEAIVLGDFNKGAHGVDYFKNIQISLIGDNLTDDHFLAPEGLHWSNKTKVELIRGTQLGDFDFSTLPYDVPKSSIKAYSINNGDSGRITYVGKTKSGIELDLIWTVIGSDKEDWAAHSGYANSKVKGLAFTGEQFFPGASGNSISVLYNNASNLGLQYQIVKHGTTVEQPVIVSFISTDIDSAQGVETDLANILEVIPPDSHLVKQDGIIYDTTKGAVNLNGSKDLPRGGYLGASFSSKFNYVFYSPAPKRVNNSYHYPKAVRYDLFGSSLQAKLLTRLQQHISVRYLDTKGKELKPEENYKGFRDKSYNIKSLSISKYQLVDIKKDISDLNHPIVTFIYSPLHTVSLHFVDENGRKLATDKTYTLLDGKNISYVPSLIAGYDLPAKFSAKITRDTDYSFVYKKTIKPSNTKPTTVKPSNPGTHHHAKPSVKQKKTPHPHTRPRPLIRHTNPQQSKPKNTQANKTIPRQKPKQSEAPRDPFLVNTNMNKEEKKLFLDYIKEVSRQARKKYGNDKHKINHAIANAIAYPVYKNDNLQPWINDFGDKPNVKNYKDIAAKLVSIHGKLPYKIDFPHFGTTLAAAEKSGFLKEAAKWALGMSGGGIFGISPHDNFFQQDSLTGDLLTQIDRKDYRTDIDALIFHYHPDYKNLTLDEAIIKYYSTENLDLERQRLYQEVLKHQAGSFVSPKEQERLNIFFASLSLGGVLLMGITAYRKLKQQWAEFKKSPSGYVNKVWRNLRDGAVLFFKDPLEFTGSKILGPAADFVADSIVFGSILARKVAGRLYDNVIKPVAKIVNKRIIQPLKKYVFKPVYKHVIKPVLKFTENKILKPVVRKVVKPVVKFVHKNIVRPFIKHVVKPVYRFVKPIYRHVVKPVYRLVVKPIYRRIVRPVYRRVIKPVYRRVVKPIYRRIVRPVYRRVIKPIYRKLIKPVVTPIYRKVIRPAGRFVKNKIFKPVSRFVKNKIAKPIARFWKRIWG